MSMSPASSSPTLPAPAPWKPPASLPERFETDRLVLRFPVASDAAAYFEMISASRDTLLPWMPWARTDHLAPEQTVYYIEKCRRTHVDAPGTNYAIGIFDRTTGRVLGGTGLHRIIADWHEAETGYFVRSDARNHGICTEAIRGLITWALTAQERGGWGLRRIHIRCAAKNLASQRVPRKLGLREEARLVQERWVSGIGWDDTLVWGVVAEEWDVNAKVRKV